MTKFRLCSGLLYAMSQKQNFTILEAEPTIRIQFSTITVRGDKSRGTLKSLCAAISFIFLKNSIQWFFFYLESFDLMKDHQMGFIKSGKHCYTKNISQIVTIFNKSKYIYTYRMITNILYTFNSKKRKLCTVTSVEHRQDLSKFWL